MLHSLLFVGIGTVVLCLFPLGQLQANEEHVVTQIDGIEGSVPRDIQPQQASAFIQTFEDAWKHYGETGIYEVEAEVFFWDPAWKLAWLVDRDGYVDYLSIDSEVPFDRIGQRIQMRSDRVNTQQRHSSEFEFKLLKADEFGFSSIVVHAPEDAVRLRKATVVHLSGLVVEDYWKDDTHKGIALAIGNELWRGFILAEQGSQDQYLGKFVEFDAVYVPEKKYSDAARDGEIWIPGNPVVSVIGTLAEDTRFAGPVIPIRNLHSADDSLVVVNGEVVSQVPGQMLKIIDDTGSMVVKTGQTFPVPQGSRVEVIGNPGQEAENRLVLNNGLFRLLDDSPLALVNAGAQAIGTAREVREALSQVSGKDDAEASRVVDMTGIVLGVDPYRHLVYLRDITGGISVEWNPDDQDKYPGVGQDVRLLGLLDLDQPSVDVVGHALVGIGGYPIPQPRMVGANQIVNGQENSQWISVIAYVVAIDSSNTYGGDGEANATQRVELVSSYGRLDAVVLDDISDKLKSGGIYEISGVPRPFTGERYEGVNSEILVFRSSDMKLIEDVNRDPFGNAEEVEDLVEFQPNPYRLDWVRYKGLILHQEEQRYLYLNNGKNDLRAILTDVQASAIEGATVEVAGVVSTNEGGVLINAGILRTSEETIVVEPNEIEHSEGLEALHGGEWVRVSGRILRVSHLNRNTVLSISFDQHVIEIVLHGGFENRDLREGSFVQLTGVFIILNDHFGQRSYSIQASDLSDIEVFSVESWWNARRLSFLAVALILFLLISFGWVGTLRRRVKEQTREIENRLDAEREIWAINRDIVNQVSDFIFTANVLERITVANPYVKQLIGRDSSEVIGEKYSELFVMEDGSVPDFQVSERLPFETRCLIKSETRGSVWVSVRLRSFIDTSEKQSILGIVHDISDRMEYEEALRNARNAAEANARAKTAFLANMSHEIRTPMNGIIGMGNLMLDTELSKEQQSFVDTIRTSSESLLNIINDILDLSKIEAGKLVFEKIPFRLGSLVEDVATLLSPIASEKQVDMEVIVGSSVPASFVGDPSRIKQVLLNIAGNAVKFTESGSVRIVVSAEDQSDSLSAVHIDVIDTGIGIESEKLGRLFTPFEQADDSTSRKFGGTGLGLSISKQLVDLMSGQISVKSVVGEGSTFSISMAIEKDLKVQPICYENLIETFANDLAVVIDPAINGSEYVASYFANWGLKVQMFQDFEAAIEMIKDNAVCLVFVKNELIEDLAHAKSFSILRSLLKEDTHIVVINDMERMVSESTLTSMGCDSYLSKPFRRRRVLDVLCRIKGIDFNSVYPTLTQKKVHTESLKGNVLIVEDNKVNQKVAMHQLRKFGLDIEIASSGVECLEQLQKQSFDLILMDCQMPEMDGYECTRKIRENPEYDELPIVAMTAHVMEGDRQLCFDAGMNDFISKPVRPDDLLELLLRVGLS